MKHLKRCLILVLLVILPLSIIIWLLHFPHQAYSLNMFSVDSQKLFLPEASSGNNELELLSQLGGGGSVNAVAVSGTFAYVGEDNGFRILDVTDPMTPVLQARVILTNGVGGIDIAGTTAYVANSDNGLQIIDVSDPTTPIRLGNYLAPSQLVSVKVADNLAYVTYGFDEPSGMVILDVTNPAFPVILSDYPLPGGADGIDVHNGIAYVSASDAGLFILDVTNPITPSLLGSYDTPGYAESVHVVDGIAYVADGGMGGLQIIDITTPTSPMLLGSYDTEWYAVDVQVVGDVAYVADTGYGGLLIVDVANPATPILLGEYETFNAYDVQVVKSQAYVAAPGGLDIVNINDPENPTLTAHYYPDIYTVVEPVGDVVYAAAGHTGMHLVDVSNPATSTIHAVYDYASFNIVTAENRIYANNPMNGFHILDASHPFTPTFLGGYQGETEVKQVTNGLGYGIYRSICSKITRCDYLQIIDISDPTSPTLLGSYYLASYYWMDSLIGDIRVKGGFAYMTLSAEGSNPVLRIMDVRNPLAPTVVSEFVLNGRPTGSIQLSGNLVYAALATEGLQLIDVSHPQTPFTFASYPDIVVNKLLIADDLIFTTSAHQIEVRNRYNLAVLAANPLVISGDLKVADDLVYVTSHDGELSILRANVDVEVTRFYLPVVQR